MHRVAILSYNHCALFELGCAVELFGLPRPEFDHWYDTEVVTFDAGLLEATGGIQLGARQITTLNEFDSLVVPSWPTETPSVSDSLATELLDFYRAGKRILSFCSGAFLLAELGILSAGKATTHWRYAERFKQRYPHIDYVEDVLYLYDGRVGCSAGSAAGIDLGIEVIRGDHGYQIANQVARRLVMSAHRSGGQSQFVETPMLEVPNQFAGALDWAIEHLSQPFSIDKLASIANMSRRTFDRKFRNSFNLSANDWLINQRIDKVKAQLENQQGSIEQASERAGFESSVTMRHHFRKRVGVTPLQYRQQFCGTLSVDAN
ncbi:helix-turn-helix domain-containing protein [Aestuariirhabdus sp. Z084]|uniref:helix-turn-helix domain-containing protein n=1 Tax=Aestuariirhabdus haliotis TaxID=2918751 RepID=UPI00201B42DB|nr:helix-turn-helix domain-containing protein [Aestuariirhabdus haliotis]MCL6415027.1 helix-turn-helix domain-containing protein [Aestuariirhabdus haliotis]MCL6418959.1 helix-turn-helix domain-containing protein [Aestuariirhabdus haliotis]